MHLQRVMIGVGRHQHNSNGAYVQETWIQAWIDLSVACHGLNRIGNVSGNEEESSILIISCQELIFCVTEPEMVEFEIYCGESEWVDREEKKDATANPITGSTTGRI